jgi:hypothetical protein
LGDFDLSLDQVLRNPAVATIAARCKADHPPPSIALMFADASTKSLRAVMCSGVRRRCPNEPHIAFEVDRRVRAEEVLCAVRRAVIAADISSV